MIDFKKSVLMTLALIAFGCWCVMAIMMLINISKNKNGCYYRYNYDQNGKLTTQHEVYDNVYLRADGNYDIIDNSNNSSSAQLALNENSYGKWLNTGVYAYKGSKMNIAVVGEVSLCKAYIPAYNLQSEVDKDAAGALIPIPRIDEGLSEPVSLIFNAQKGEWGNVIKLDKGDRYVVSIKSSSNAAQTLQKDFFLNNNVEANCSSGARTYSPICGKYSVWGNTDYVTSCSFNVNACNCVGLCQDSYLTGGSDEDAEFGSVKDVCFNQCSCNDFCEDEYVTALSKSGCKTNYHDRKSGLVYKASTVTAVKRFTGCVSQPSCGSWNAVSRPIPDPYNADGSKDIGWIDDLTVIDTNFLPDCNVNSAYINGEYQSSRKFWFTSDKASGLLYRFDDRLEPTKKTERGNDFMFAKIRGSESPVNATNAQNILLEGVYDSHRTSYLQYRFASNDDEFVDNTGGYIINVRQTKCIRENGNAFDDDIMEGRGRIQYAIVHPSKDVSPDEDTDAYFSELSPDTNGADNITIPTSKEGYLWLKIANMGDDYKNSIGQYNVSISRGEDNKDFFSVILNPLFETLKTKISNIGQTIFKNMTCYQTSDGNASCNNFFNYIRGLLILYIITYSAMFLIGTVQIHQSDLVIRVAKIAIVAGLINEQTVEFFNDYVFNFVTGFSDEIISNMSGYSFFSTETSITNPFMFLNEILTKVFLSPTFMAQIMALISMGPFGIFYFIIVVISILMMLLVAFRAIAVYIMAFMATAFLIGIAPLFLTFLLFESTKYLFDNWVKFTFRYMMEPVIMLAGIIILTQLFTIYLDYIIGYSVCWKCAIPIKIPFPASGVSPAFLDVELFCINWFAPWGIDHRSGSIGMDMTNMIALLIIGYCMWGYIDFAGKLTANLVGGGGGAYATSMGKAVSNFVEDTAAYAATGKNAQERANIINRAKPQIESAAKKDLKSFIGKGKDNQKDGENEDGEKSGSELMKLAQTMGGGDLKDSMFTNKNNKKGKDEEEK